MKNSGLQGALDLLKLKAKEIPALEPFIQDIENELTHQAKRKSTPPTLQPVGALIDSFLTVSKRPAYLMHEKEILPSGLSAFDEKFTGFRRGEVVMVAGRPNMGKTGLLLTFMLHQAKSGKKCLYATPWEQSGEVTARILSFLSGIRTSAIMNRQIREKDGATFFECSQNLKEMKISYAYGWLQFQDLLISLEEKEEVPDVLVLDDFYIFHSSYFEESRIDYKVRDSFLHLIQFARRHNILVLVGGYLNPTVEYRSGDMTPNLSDLSEGPSFENIPDKIILLSRIAEYGILQDEAGTDMRGNLKLQLRRNRYGETGTLNYEMDLNNGLVKDYTPTYFFRFDEQD